MFEDVTAFIFASDPPEAADAVVIPGNIYPEPALRAAQLYAEGYAERFYVSGRFSKGLSCFPGPARPEAAAAVSDIDPVSAGISAVSGNGQVSADLSVVSGNGPVSAGLSVVSGNGPVSAGFSVSSNRDALPEAETGLSETETGLPETETGLPETETGLPETETGLSKPETGLPETETGLPSDFYDCSYETEADMIRSVLMLRGVPEEAIFCDREATFTYENALNIRAMMEAVGPLPETVIICCQAIHARRCKMYFEYVFRDLKTRFLVCPVKTQGVGPENWLDTDRGRRLVFGELERCGQQFGMMLAKKAE